jgi:hypothetical protein
MFSTMKEDIVVNNPIVITKEVSIFGNGHCIQAKNPDEPIFEVRSGAKFRLIGATIKGTSLLKSDGDSIDISLSSVYCDTDSHLVEYNNKGEGTLWMVGCGDAKCLAKGVAENSNVVAVGCTVKDTNDVFDLVAKNKISFNNYNIKNGIKNKIEPQFDYKDGILHNEPTSTEVLTFQKTKELSGVIFNKNIKYVVGIAGVDTNSINAGLHPHSTSEEHHIIFDSCTINSTEGLPKESIFLNCYVETYSTDFENFLFINPYTSLELEEPIKFSDRMKGTW